MKLIKFLALTFSILFTNYAFSGDIAYGEILGIKVYNFSNSKVTKIQFKDSASHTDEDTCNRTAVISHSLHASGSDQKMLSIALAGYMSGKNVRAYSETTGSCEAALIAVQDSYY